MNGQLAHGNAGSFAMRYGPFLLIAAFVAALRGLYFGDPVINIDSLPEVLAAWE